VLQSGQRITLGLLSTFTLEVVPFRAYAPFPVLSQIFKCILEVVFCEGVQHRLRFCLEHLNCVKMEDFQFYLQSRKKRNVWWVGKTFRNEKGSVRWCVVVMQEPDLLSPMFWVGRSARLDDMEK
jgi:hypothetical protein